MNHQGQVPRDAISQMGLLPEAQVEATKADGKNGNLQRMITDHTNKSLMAYGQFTTENSNPIVLASQAEVTVQSHSKDVYCPGCTPGWEPSNCFVYLDPTCCWKISGNVACACHNDPGNQECALKIQHEESNVENCDNIDEV